MKTVTRRLSAIGKLSLFAGLLISGQQAFAQDTNAGTDISNQAFVNFSVGTIPQTQVDSNTVVFEVDRRVDFEVTLENGALTDVTPGETNLFLPFLITNESNDTIGFNLSERTLANGETVRGTTATGQAMANVTIEAAADFIGGGGSETPVRGAGNANVVSLPPTETIRVYIWVDAPASLPDGSIPALELAATAAIGGTALIDNSGDADDPTLVQNVFVNAPVGNNAVLVNQDGFNVAGATIGAVKDSTVLSDPVTPVGPGANPKAIPGAVVEYSIVLTNSGSADASAITINDTLDVANLVLLDDTYGAGQNVDLDGATCNADADAADGCTFDPVSGALLITLPAPLAGGGTTQTIRFEVQIQ